MEPLAITSPTGVSAHPALVDIVVPVHNEAKVLERNITTLHRYLADRFPFAWRITIAENGSTDGTDRIANRLAAGLPDVYATHIDENGRGRALRASWFDSPADVVAYMDVDLSTDLGALLPLVAPLVSGHSDLAIGSRLAPGARVVRRPLRELASRVYNALVRLLLAAHVHDAQCGFKAATVEAAHVLLPAVLDESWFFDTELIVAARRVGLRVFEVPVDWTDDLDSRVDVVRTTIDDLRGIWRLALARLPRRSST